MLDKQDGGYVSYEDYTALEARCLKLAAENAGLKAICDDRRTFIMNGVQLGFIQVPTVETDPALETIRIAVSPQEPTPATDAFLAEVRAQGVEMFGQWLRDSADIFDKNSRHDWADQNRVSADKAGEFADQLRKGVQS
ncbi:hypothetical protein [Enterobacter cloacae complex sp. 2021EL-01169]|uniref:hypothetical protein n=1 Tax=Enterobacter cloacae complex sp. 2021EL-01169 TaxID=2887193 RepID=UPI001D14E93F|nr:hypothetical protein [Enterobacter cloacae complex sp. 2021EL-01169]MCC3240645.1 hypothetical protein [Enterobacter cloacae complex sp. 2021EL-01169]